MYSVKNLLVQSPEELKGGILIILAALVATHVIDVSPEATALWGLVIERVLSWFYVKPLTVNKARMQDLADETLKNIEFGKDLAADVTQATKAPTSKKR